MWTLRADFSLKFACTLALAVCLLGGPNSKKDLWQVAYRRPQKEAASPAVLNDVFFLDRLHGWVVGDGGVVLQTVDGGRSWTEHRARGNIRAVLFTSPTHGMIAGDLHGSGVIQRTEDGGENWNMVYRLTDFSLSSFSDVSMADEGVLVAVGEGERDGLVRGLVCFSLDGGATWTLDSEFPAVVQTLQAVRFAGKQFGITVGEHRVFVTSDGGKTWTSSHFRQDRFVFGAAINKSGIGFVVGSRGYLIRSTEGGSAWTQLNTNTTVWLADILFADGRRGWVCGENGAILSTIDGGESWKLESVGTASFLRGLAATSDAVFAVGNEGVIVKRPIP